VSAVSHVEVRPEEEGWRLDRWAKARYPGLGFGQLQKLCRTGQFRVDGKRVEAGARLAPGQVVRVPPLGELPDPAAKPAASRRQQPQPEDAAFIRGLVVHEDDRLIALNKPAGLAVQGGSGTTCHVDALLDALARKGGERPRLVHRLDRGTSGLLVVAKSAAAARELAFAFQQHRVKKLYWAVLLKGPERNHGLIDVPLAKAGPAGQEKMRVRFKDDEGEEGGDGRNARTRFMVLARAGKVAAWTALVPLTGRTHQLRAHAAAIGCPILGDGKYGGKAAHPTGAPKGLMLHARELELPGPGRRSLRLTAEPPREFKEGLRWLGLEQPELPGARLEEWRD
jgi:23S rRNA pseudouridine955/2504/2580 synthase